MSHNHYRRLKLALEEEKKEIKNKNWQDKMLHTADKYKDSREFWKEIKRLKGNKSPINPLEVNNKTITTDQGKDETHRTIWKEIFKITQEENQNYCRIKEEEIEDFLLRNPERHLPDSFSNLNILKGNTELDCLIS